MFDIDTWREIFQSISKNKTRSVLSGFTVAFAIFLFAVLFGMANGLKNTFKEQFGDRVVNAIHVYPWRTSKAYKGFQAGRHIQLKNEDVAFLKNEFGDKIEYLVAKVYQSAKASFGNNKNNYSLTAVTPDFQHLEQNILMEGRYINQKDLQDKTKVIVIGRLVKEDLFVNIPPLGKYVNLNGIQYKVVGVFRDEDGDRAERSIAMPITTSQQLYGNTTNIGGLSLTYNKNMDYDEAIAFSNTLKTKLKKHLSIAPSDQNGIYVSNFADSLKEINQMTFALSALIFVIGFGTLIAGIVGISNIMIFIVKERTKEIGIRKALGAQPNSIVSIILIESILITTIAGYVGLIAGIGLLELAKPTLAIYHLKDPSVSFSLVLSATITLILSGAIAGYLPVKKASRIKPIVALKND